MKVFSKEKWKKILLWSGVSITVILGIALAIRTGNSTLLKSTLSKASSSVKYLNSKAGSVFVCIGKKIPELLAEGYDHEQAMMMAASE